MKTILRKMMPLAVFVLGIGGAFTTMSMQSAEKDALLVDGWAKSGATPCSFRVNCSDTGSITCRVSYGPNNTGGEIALHKTPTMCIDEYYKP